MPEQSIRVLIVDDNEKARDRLIEQLRFADLTVVGESGFGPAAYNWAEQLAVDVVVVAIEEPVARSLQTIESLSVGATSWPVLGVSTLGDRETTRKAIQSGVRDHLVLPASDETLHQAIISIHRTEQGRRSALAVGQTAGRVGTIVAVIGVKGGIGKSTVSTNLAVSLAEQTRQQVVLVDLDLQFGDSAVMLDIVPTKTIEDAGRDLTGNEPQFIQGYLTEHPTRLKVLSAPKTPEGAETLSADQIGRIVEMLAATNDFVVIDTSAQIDAVSLKIMDMATMILLVVIPEVPCVRRSKAVLDLMREWGYSRDKVKLIVNRARDKSEVPAKEIELVLDYPIYYPIPEDQAAVRGISLGAPVVISAPKSQAGRAFAELGRNLVGMPQPKRRGLLRRKEADQILPSEWDPTSPLARVRAAQRIPQEAVAATRVDGRSSDRSNDGFASGHVGD